ncbi:TrmH family RNA methyltransferase [Bacillus andreraoultii]|uniref:TrmH family RNA methyltransferase n=1 Tax=Bacillus andreraoultii TaxID=1499685 RepID=UPI00053B2974|nr:RNA methyltransferase [Bacillus andreraoultii]
MKFIQSVKNEKVKQWKKLLTKKERDKTGLFLVEGEHLVEEAHHADWMTELIVTESYHSKLPKAKFANIDLYVVANEIAKVISDTETPQGIFAVCKQMKKSVVEGKRYLLIDAVQDPGNVGTMIRTADSAGVDAVIVGEGSVDIWNAKVLRAAQGSHFHLPIIRGNLTEWINKFREQNISIYGTALKNAVPMNQVQAQESFALIVGNEGQGVNEELLSKTTKNLYIPIYGKSESLNVSVATGILLYYLRGKH